MADSFNCQRCQLLYAPPPGAFIFYGLCDHCFNLFDNQKMQGRFSGLFGKERPSYYESSVEWIKAFPYRADEAREANIMTDVYAILNQIAKPVSQDERTDGR